LNPVSGMVRTPMWTLYFKQNTCIPLQLPITDYRLFGIRAFLTVMNEALVFLSLKNRS